MATYIIVTRDVKRAGTTKTVCEISLGDGSGIWRRKLACANEHTLQTRLAEIKSNGEDWATRVAKFDNDDDALLYARLRTQELNRK
jgi:hypothetical protein